MRYIISSAICIAWLLAVLPLVSTAQVSSNEYGKSLLPVSYHGIRERPPADDTANLLPATLEYFSLMKYRQSLLEIMSVDGFTDIHIPGTKGIQDSSLVIARLSQLGIDTSVSIHPAVFSDLVKKVQSLFNIQPDGQLGPLTITAMNVPLARRVRSLEATLNTLYWMYGYTRSGPAVVVNIPAAGLFFYESGSIVFESRIIPGKPSTPTPTLSSSINQVVLYPYWHVPYSIATKELLPLFKKNPGLVNDGNYQVLDKKGKIVPPASIDWAALNAKNFPYVLRQSTGCDNALGWIKLNFDNPFSVYLHDTPGKVLFNMRRRFFSHGCMRVEKAVDLARKLLAGNTKLLDSLEKMGPLKNQAPVPITLTNTVPVFVFYQTAWFDSGGNIRFFEDIYKKD